MPNQDPNSPYYHNERPDGPPEPPPYHSAPRNPYRANGYQQPRPYLPDNHLILAIIATLFGCFPLGIVAIVYASKVESRYYIGDYEGALRAANQAKKWSIISLVCIGVLISIYLLLVFLVVMGALASLPSLIS